MYKMRLQFSKTALGEVGPALGRLVRHWTGPKSYHCVYAGFWKGCIAPCGARGNMRALGQL